MDGIMKTSLDTGFYSYYLHIFLTFILIPVFIAIFNRYVKRLDDNQNMREEQWRNFIKDELVKIGNKLTKYCEENNQNHVRFERGISDVDSRVTKIETIHHQRGCDQPYNRRKIDYLGGE
jgi:hypothetical protein